MEALVSDHHIPNGRFGAKRPSESGEPSRQPALSSLTSCQLSWRPKRPLRWRGAHNSLPLPAPPPGDPPCNRSRDLLCAAPSRPPALRPLPRPTCPKVRRPHNQVNSVS